MMVGFYNTVGGRRFIDGTVPELVTQVRRVATALERLVTLLEARTPVAEGAGATATFGDAQAITPTNANGTGTCE